MPDPGVLVDLGLFFIFIFIFKGVDNFFCKKISKQLVAR